MTYKQKPRNGRQWRSDEEGPVGRFAAAVQWQRAAAATTVCCIVGLLLLIHPGARYHASETAKAILPVSESRRVGSPVLRFSSNRQGLCRLEYTVKSWDDKNVPVCDPSLCLGREKLELLDAAGSPRRWSTYYEALYIKLVRDNGILGWLKLRQVSNVRVLTAMQHKLGIYGAVGEIGVHHGKFFIGIVGNALAAEPAVAIDLFEDQSANVDISGNGSKALLLRNLERTGLPEGSITLMEGNSMYLSPANFTARGFPAFRMLSVDGGHTMEITLHDLMVASCLIRDGGLVILDDFPNPTWLGVAEALMHFVHAQDRLVPFMHGANKVWFTTASHVQQYQELIANNPQLFPCTNDHTSKQTIAGYSLCWTGYN